ncbi:helix-turn-helix domain-containing protein [Streptomyces sp. NPDC096013]|uniref:helix-turn-helix domain-containing protein n=1 Tax=Streptomyces sp. NPDC096013 TaxID=3366069 RepID=UPI00382068AE
MGREHRAWTLAALGDRLGCSPATVSRLERSNRVVDRTLVHRAALEVGVPRHVLVSSDDVVAPRRAVRSAVPQYGELRAASLFNASVIRPRVLTAGCDPSTPFVLSSANATPADWTASAKRSVSGVSARPGLTWGAGCPRLPSRRLPLLLGRPSPARCPRLINNVDMGIKFASQWIVD